MKTNRELYFDIFNKLDFARIIDHPNILIAANFWDEVQNPVKLTTLRR